MNIQERLQCTNLLEVHNKLMQCHESGQNHMTKFDELLVKKHHKFLWEDTNNELSWEEELAKKYYNKLFKEYCICDLSKYKENKVALRWRTKNEVISGRGQFSCSEKRCSSKESLKTWEVNFCYIENNEKKNALVKIKLCPDCSTKLNYHNKKREIKRLKKRITSSKRKDKKKYETEDDTQEEVPTTSLSKSKEDNQNPWTEKVEVEIKSRDDEMDDYLDELLF